VTVTHMRPRRLQPQQRRELDTAAAMFAEQPHDDVMIQDIAARAGVSRALMYHYFSTKRRIHRAIQARQ
jgi:AcrR family transcriptional regulator